MICSCVLGCPNGEGGSDGDIVPVDADEGDSDVDADVDLPDVESADADADLDSEADSFCGTLEVCDGFDNNCNGFVDEELGRPCEDLCGGEGRQSCIDGAWQRCEPNAPTVEVCDTVDNDCDGLVDEELSCPAPKPRLTVLILAGQSNMVGLGYNSELSGDDDDPVPSAHIYYNDSVHTNPNADSWTGLGPGFGYEADRFGPELSFGRRLRELWPTRTVAILKVAEGGTAIFDRWTARTGDLYQLLTSEIELQMGDLHIEWRPQIAGFVWMQGESDAIEQPHARAYYDRLRDFIEALRVDAEVALLPVAAGLIVEDGLWPFATTVRNGTTALSLELGPMTTVETNDLPRHADDPAHYNSASNLILGQRFAEAVAAMHGNNWAFPDDATGAQGDGYFRFFARLPSGEALPLSFNADDVRFVGEGTSISIEEVLPAADRDAEIAWWMPLAGRLQVVATASATGDAGGDGTEVSITDGDRLIWGPALLTTGRSFEHTFEMDMAQGEELFFRTSSGPAGDVEQDGVRWEIDISVLSFDE